MAFIESERDGHPWALEAGDELFISYIASVPGGGDGGNGGQPGGGSSAKRERAQAAAMNALLNFGFVPPEVLRGVQQ